MKVTLALPAALACPTLALASEGAAANPFAGTIYQSIAAVVIFVLLLTLLRRFAWGPILKGLQDRESNIREDLEHAEESARHADETLKEYQAQLAQAREQARKIIDQGRADAERIAAQLKSETQAEIKQIRDRAQNEIRLAKEQALAEIYAQTATLATLVAGHILRREIKPEEHRALIEQSLSQMDRARTN